MWWDTGYNDRGNTSKFSTKARLGNSEWCALCNEDIRTIIYAWDNTQIISTILKKPQADESIFSVTLYLTNRFKNTINESITIMDWERDPYGLQPHMFSKPYTQEDKNIIKSIAKHNKFAMFIRKVDSSFPDEVIYKWIKL